MRTITAEQADSWQRLLTSKPWESEQEDPWARLSANGKGSAMANAALAMEIRESNLCLGRDVQGEFEGNAARNRSYEGQDCDGWQSSAWHPGTATSRRARLDAASDDQEPIASCKSNGRAPYQGGQEGRVCGDDCPSSMLLDCGEPAHERPLHGFAYYGGQGTLSDEQPARSYIYVWAAADGKTWGSPSNGRPPGESGGGSRWELSGFCKEFFGSQTAAADFGRRRGQDVYSQSARARADGVKPSYAAIREDDEDVHIPHQCQDDPPGMWTSDNESKPPMLKRGSEYGGSLFLYAGHACNGEIVSKHSALEISWCYTRCYCTVMFFRLQGGACAAITFLGIAPADWDSVLGAVFWHHGLLTVTWVDRSHDCRPREKMHKDSVRAISHSALVYMDWFCDEENMHVNSVHAISKSELVNMAWTYGKCYEGIWYLFRRLLYEQFALHFREYANANSVRVISYWCYQNDVTALYNQIEASCSGQQMPSSGVDTAESEKEDSVRVISESLIKLGNSPFGQSSLRSKLCQLLHQTLSRNVSPTDAICQVGFSAGTDLTLTTLPILLSRPGRSIDCGCWDSKNSIFQSPGERLVQQLAVAVHESLGHGCPRTHIDGDDSSEAQYPGWLLGWAEYFEHLSSSACLSFGATTLGAMLRLLLFGTGLKGGPRNFDPILRMARHCCRGASFAFLFTAWLLPMGAAMPAGAAANLQQMRLSGNLVDTVLEAQMAAFPDDRGRLVEHNFATVDPPNYCHAPPEPGGGAGLGAEEAFEAAIRVMIFQQVDFYTTCRIPIDATAESICNHVASNIIQRPQEFRVTEAKPQLADDVITLCVSPAWWVLTDRAGVIFDHLKLGGQPFIGVVPTTCTLGDLHIAFDRQIPGYAVLPAKCSCAFAKRRNL